MGRTLATVLLALWPALALTQTSGEIRGLITDATGAPLPGVTVEARRAGSAARSAVVTDSAGRYELTGLAEGAYDVSASLINFATYMSNGVVVRPGHPITIDVRLTLAVSADVTVTGMSSFTNLADVADPAANLIGVAFAASQGAITPRELDTRPIMRASEVLETVPGLVISQHSGEGKANQYHLRGFNLDHGTDFATTVAGMPINLPTHAHGHGYADSNFLIPELVSGVQYRRDRTSPTWVTSRPPGPRTSTTRIRCLDFWRASAAERTVGRARSSPPPHESETGSCSTRSSSGTTMGRGSGPTTSGSSTAFCGTAAAMHKTGCR